MSERSERISQHSCDVVRFTTEHVERFAAATGDRNPLHLDPRYARRTVQGEPVVHGALAAATLLGTLGTDAARVCDLRVDVHHPIRTGARLRIVATPGEQAGTLALCLGDLRLCAVRYQLDARSTADTPVGGAPPEARTAAAGEPARVFDVDGLAALGAETGTLRADLSEVRALAATLTGPVPDHLAGMLAWASYWTGMRTPGRDALLCTLRVRYPAPAPSTEEIRCRVGAPVVQRRTGLVQLDAELTGRVRARVRVESVVRRRVPQATAGSMAGYRPPGDRLADRTVLVLGGSRGLGRALALGCAAQGARVLVASREPEAHVMRMRVGLGNRAALVEPLPCAAGDPDTLRAALSAAVSRLDGLMLCSGPPIASLPLHADATQAGADYVSDCVRQFWAPLSVCRDLLTDKSFLLVVSSVAVTEPPVHWAHYAAAKGALEALATYAARHHPWRVIVARPPRLRTDLTNTPTGHARAVPPEAYAARVLGAVLRNGDGVPHLTYLD
jgi:NAD(P)-dependent dehydrogenase (short-subunit alcohol dehydrogenase family)/acyl dehydratase